MSDKADMFLANRRTRAKFAVVAFSLTFFYFVTLPVGQIIDRTIYRSSIPQTSKVSTPVANKSIPAPQTPTPRVEEKSPEILPEAKKEEEQKETEKTQEICNTFAEYVNMREGPSSQVYAVKRRLNNHTEVTIIGQENSPSTGHKWFKIRLEDGTIGFIDHEKVADDCEEVLKENTERQKQLKENQQSEYWNNMPNSSFSLSIRNVSQFRVEYKLFSKSRKKLFYPGNNQFYYVDSGGSSKTTFSCKINESICLGAWTSKNKNITWGVGVENSLGCKNCCFTCNGGNYDYGFSYR